jgi:hypothetical protein
MRYGTSYFATRYDAESYYRRIGYGPGDVKAKLDAGEIHVGHPPLKPGETCHLIAGENRYEIEKGESP